MADQLARGCRATGRRAQSLTRATFVPCDPAPIVGLSRTSEGEITATVELCPNRRGRRIEIVDADGAVRWRASSARGSADTQYTVGVEPEGFTTDVSLVTEPRAGAWIHLDAAAPRFDPQRARVGDVYYGGRYFTAGEFAAEARNSLGCPSDDPVPLSVSVVALAGALTSGGALFARALRRPANRWTDQPPPPSGPRWS